jgi:hypothetical protein
MVVPLLAAEVYIEALCRSFQNMPRMLLEKLKKFLITENEACVIDALTRETLWNLKNNLWTTDPVPSPSITVFLFQWLPSMSKPAKSEKACTILSFIKLWKNHRRKLL